MGTTLQDYRRFAKDYNLIPVTREVLCDLETPVAVLRRFAGRQNAFLLESVEGGEQWGRYSFIGVDPELLFEIDYDRPGRHDLQGGLRSIYKGLRPAPAPGLPRFIGGGVGFIGYEAAGEFERLPPAAKNYGRQMTLASRFLRVDKLIVFDNLRHTIQIVVCSRPDAAGAPEEEAFKLARAEIDKIEAVLRRPALSGEERAYPLPEFSSNMSPEEYCGMVEKTRKYITSGDIIQAVLSQRFSARTDVPPLEIYRALRLLNPSPYMYFLKIGGQVLVGSSPETMVRLTGNRIELRPIAGTRPRGATEQEDRRLADELLSDEKEKAEHVMLVDLGRNDVGRVAEIGSVQVRDYMTIERYSHVMHIVSQVEGILRKDCDAADVLKAAFPAGTLSGAPKIRAMEIINELEPGPRGVYGGAVGYVGYDGSMDLAITIRTIEVLNGTAFIQAGAGLVYNSEPRREYEETCRKAQAMKEAVILAAGGLRLEASAAHPGRAKSLPAGET
ncbi:MAG: anthranilate synthase component I [Kiritimatiellae bacterium]|nr:anthranilate synthase component I [Kiritimatiellia bacterium]